MVERRSFRAIGAHAFGKRMLGALLAAGLVAIALTGCIGQAVRSTEQWLAVQPHVVAIGVPDSTVDELSYKATIRAELDPTATDADIRTLIDNSLAFIGGQQGNNVALQFGINNIDFEVATKADARLALALWRPVVQTPHIVAGFVTKDAVSVSTLRTDAFTVFNALDSLHVQRHVAGYHSQTDFAPNSSDFTPPLRLNASPECDVALTVLNLAAAAMSDTRVDFGTLDLCSGFDVTFNSGYAIADGVASVRATLDAAGLSYFPVKISVAPADYGSADFHIVSVTPGDATSLAVVATLEASGVKMRYELDSLRALTVQSSTATVAELFAVLSPSSAAAGLGTITITGTDASVSGSFAELPSLVAAH